MKLVFVSDIHGSAYYARMLPEIDAREKPERIVLLGDLLIHGHTHVQAMDPFGQDNLYLNPGSVSLPKEGNENSYMTYEDGLFTIKAMDGRPIRSTRI